MLYVKENPIGVDIPIQKIQKHLYKNLLRIWGIRQDRYNSFCRIYKNQTKKGYKPEFYLGNNEYRDAFFDDKVSVTSFFSVGDKSKYEDGRINSDISVTFCVNLKDLKPKINHRADEEVRQDVLELIDRFILASYEIGIDDVFSEYDRESITFRDMHPFHCFKINMKINYDKC